MERNWVTMRLCTRHIFNGEENEHQEAALCLAASYPLLPPACLVKVRSHAVSPLAAMCLYEHLPSLILGEKKLFMEVVGGMYQADQPPTETFLWWMLFVYHVFRQLDTVWAQCFHTGMMSHNHGYRPATRLISSIMIHHMGLLDTPRNACSFAFDQNTYS